MIHIADERVSDIAAREALLDTVMGGARVLKPSERIRENRLPADGLALVARDGARLVGSVRLWNIAAGGRDALLLGPLAVEKGLQGKGVGSGLMQVALARAAETGHGGIVLVGDPDYYARFGFTGAPVAGLVLPGQDDRRRFLGLELSPGALSGTSGLIVATGASAPALKDAA